MVDEDHSELSRRITHAFLPPYDNSLLLLRHVYRQLVGAAIQALNALSGCQAIRATRASPQFDRDQLAQTPSSEPLAETTVSSRLL